MERAKLTLKCLMCCDCLGGVRGAVRAFAGLCFHQICVRLVIPCLGHASFPLFADRTPTAVFAPILETESKSLHERHGIRKTQMHHLAENDTQEGIRCSSARLRCRLEYNVRVPF